MSKKVREYRTLPGDVKALEERKEEIIEEMESIVSKANAEKRDVTEEEKKKFNSLKYEVEGINQEIRSLNENSGIPNKNSEVRVIDGMIYPNEKMEKRTYSENSNLDLGKLVKGMSGLGWNGAEEERKYYRAMESGNNKVVIPEQLADQIVDYARANSAILGKIPVVGMENNNLTIAVQTKDGEAKFVKENDLIPNTDIAFKSVKLEGKTLALFVPVSEQLLETASNLTNQLMTSCSRAISIALDKALVYGEGETSETPEIKGISKYEDINKVNCDKADYDLIIKGAKAIKKANLTPTDVCLNSDLSSELEMLKTTDGQYVIPPKAIEGYEITESNNIADNEAVVFDRNTLLLGLQKGMTIEWGTSGDMFQRIQKGLRIVLRADLGVVNTKGVTVVTVNKE